MIIIRFFADYNMNFTYDYLISRYDIYNDKDYNVKYKFTNDDDYTHAILINTPIIPKNIPKENVIGLACEPYLFLKRFSNMNDTYIEYAKKHIGMYLIGDNGNDEKLSCKPFIETYPFIPYHMKYPILKPKTKLMSIMISQKLFAPGHKYRHMLVKEILKQNLPIDIYGRGCVYYKTNDPRFKGQFEETEPYLDYKFHIAIENFSTRFYISEKINNALISNTIPIYYGATNIEKYVPGQCILLNGDINHDMKIITDICNNPDKYYKNIDIDMVKKNTSIKNVINYWLN